MLIVSQARLHFQIIKPIYTLKYTPLTYVPNLYLPYLPVRTYPTTGMFQVNPRGDQNMGGRPVDIRDRVDVRNGKQQEVNMGNPLRNQNNNNNNNNNNGNNNNGDRGGDRDRDREFRREDRRDDRLRDDRREDRGNDRRYVRYRRRTCGVQHCVLCVMELAPMNLMSFISVFHIGKVCLVILIEHIVCVLCRDRDRDRDRDGRDKRDRER